MKLWRPSREDAIALIWFTAILLISIATASAPRVVIYQGF